MQITFILNWHQRTKLQNIGTFVPNWLSYIQLIRKLKVEGPKWNFDIQSIEIGGLNRTKSKLIYQKLGPKTQFKVEGPKCKVKINGGLFCTLTCRRERRRGRRLQPASAASTGMWCVHAPPREERRTRHLNMAWGRNTAGACVSRPDRRRINNSKNRANYRSTPAPNSWFLSY